MAPELLNCYGYCKKVDIWALGVITFQLLSGVLPFVDHNDSYAYLSEDQLRQNICNKQIDFDLPCLDCISESARDFISVCLDRNVDQRWTASQLLKHEWISQYSDIFNK